MSNSIINDKANSFFPEFIIDQITKSRDKANFNTASWLLIEVINFADLLLFHDDLVIFKVLDNLIEHLQQHFNNKNIWRFNFNYILVRIEGCNNYDSLELIAENFFTVIHSYSPLIKNINFYLHPSMGGIVDNDLAVSNKKMIASLFTALKNADFDQDIFYSSYLEVSKDKEIFKEEIAKANFFHQALDNDQCCLSFQPIINATNNQVEYYETLLRIKVNNEIISAGPYVAIAEKFNFIQQVDQMVLNMVIAELKKHSNLQLSMNISALLFKQKQKMHKIINILSNNLEVARRLILEITETAFINNIENASKFISEVRALGTKIAIDDFGSGYTSFKELKNMSVDILKIDRIFIEKLKDKKENIVIVKAILDIAKAANMSTVAEFVQDEETVKLLKDLKIDYMQGHYFAPAYNYKPWEQN